ncbi:DEAD/DEAH box helicase [Alkalibaculum sp. M08DMB]|uniref:DEAD/DEAH box helicase n=1 Tax=Alkalibaculum sporogenes TaxID=2655001 RepID=A0A6A7K5Q2_9FIRM|nr:DEAD/DEAH box helicase [Alkalibaculum sporogenes]MPW24671.1 DEAD/DEAH box helicase [Alkalibaculum sporogenes]
MLFENLNLIKPIEKALKNEGYTTSTPIQAKAIPPLLEGMDLLGCAQTGTGKTAAFAIPILQGLSNDQINTKGPRQIKALVLAPTRELAIQIHDSFCAYGKYLGLKTTVIYGGVSQHPQTNALLKGVDILVATPGRLLDLINQKFIRLNSIKYFVLDEADLMLDMGMINDVRKIIKYIPYDRQTMFFSATMPNEIAKLADSILKNPIKVQITPVASTVNLIKQTVYYVNKKNKTQLLIHLLKNKSIVSALVFSRTKHGADRIVKSLEKAGLQSQAIHGNKSQNARQLALNNFKERKTRILVATDIAARGIDVEELSHVFNFDLPEVPETYVHRIGRTGRAGLGGIAISFCDQEEKPLLKGIEKLIAKSITLVEDHPYPLIETASEIKTVNSRKHAPLKATSRYEDRKGKAKSSYKGSTRKSDKAKYSR